MNAFKSAEGKKAVIEYYSSLLREGRDSFRGNEHPYQLWKCICDCRWQQGKSAPHFVAW